MKFDSNLAWRDATAAVAANRDVLLALAGVFFLLPRLALSLFMPAPPQPTGNDPQAMLDAMGVLYQQMLPVMIPMILFQAVGTMAILTLFTDSTRPTVGEAIKLGARGVLPYLLAQILFGAVVMLVGGGLVLLAMLSGQQLVVAAVSVAVFVGFIAAAIHVSLAAPVVAVERVYNPAKALLRSVQLTRGNTLRLLGFWVLVLLVVGIVSWAASAAVGAVAGLAGGAALAKQAGLVVSAEVGGAFTVYVAAILASIHRQLAGPSAASISSLFE